MFDQIDIETLILKYLQGKLAEEEKRQLDEWLKDDRNKKLFSRLVNKQRILVKMERLDEYDWEKSWKVMEKKLHERKKFSWKYWGMVASLLGIVLLGTWVFMEKNEKKSPVVVMRGVEPGGVFAELVLPDGKIVELNKDSNNLFLGESGKVLRNENGVLFLTQDSVQLQKVGYSEIRTPRGGEYQVVLPDNSIVWLNADSKLRFPLTFSGKERRVFASGELYFQVAKDSLSPFRIEVEGLYEVEVLGTEFNVRAYSDLPSATTLVDGRVLIRDKGTKVVLKPGEQAVKGKHGEVVVREVDVAPYIAWKQGYFLFEDERLEDILNELARWYDVNVFFENSSVREERFSVDMPRHESFEEVLRLIEQTRSIQIEIEGNNVFVK
ncbi:FecR family protein [Butyricimonas faecihominis]